MGWSRRDDDIPVNTSSQAPLLSTLQSLNPFSSNSRGGYVRLPTQENPGAPLPAPTRREEEEGWFARKLLSVHSDLVAMALPVAVVKQASEPAQARSA
jgi:hypothetical protein